MLPGCDGDPQGSLGSTDFFAVMDNAASKVIITAAAIKIQMASRLKKARRRIAEKRAERMAADHSGQSDGDSQREAANDHSSS